MTEPGPGRGAVSRADLLEWLVERGGQLSQADARALGYRRVQVTSSSQRHVYALHTYASPEEREAAKRAGSRDENADIAAQAPFAPTSFWRAVAFEVDDLFPDPTLRTRAPQTPLPVRAPELPPPYRYLAGFAELTPRLRQALGHRRRSGRYDLARIVDSLSRAEVPQRLPRQQRPAWGNRLVVIEDRSTYLAPYGRDQAFVHDRLSELYPAVAFEGAISDETTPWPRVYPRNAPAEPYTPRVGDQVLVLGDLGSLANDRQRRAFWIEFGNHAVAVGATLTALVPCAMAEVRSGLRALYQVLSWEYPQPPVLSAAELKRDGERLLDLLALSSRNEPGLLREQRLALSPNPPPARIEAWLWQHPAMQRPDRLAGSLTRDQIRERRAALALDDAGKSALARVDAWLRHSPWELWLETVLAFTDDPAATFSAQDQQAARQLLTYLVERAGSGPGGALTPAAWDWLEGFLERQGDRFAAAPATRAAHHALSTALAAHRRGEGLVIGSEPRRIDLFHAGSDILCAGEGGANVRNGSPLASLRSRDGQLWFEIEGGGDIEPSNAFWINRRSPEWAADWGWDEIGAWVEFIVGGVRQLMRWIPPGKFMMGSPVDEPGRFDNEGPQHDVIIDNGFWMLDRPVSPLLWEVVMGANAMRSRIPAWSFETLSWVDVQSFITQLNARLPGLALELPSEARWEYACRAGSVGSFYRTLPHQLRGVDRRDRYSGNDSGQQQEQEQTWPNAWGLFHMLGNDLEWTGDHWHDDYVGAPVDGSAWIDPGGGDRVLRGSMWVDGARYVRCATRYFDARNRPGARVSFRFARVQGGAEPDTDGAARQAERRVHSAGRGGAAGQEEARRFGVHLRLDVPADGANAERQEIPDAPRLIVRTDLERLVLERLPRDTQWADEMGRDRHGLWAEFAFQGVRQRLRWIPPGCFLMGSPDDEPGRMDREGPRHEVTFAQGYWLFDTPVTQALWQAVMGDNPARFQSPTRPVELVDFAQAHAFMERLNTELPALKLALPSEAQWEYACRAGTQTALYSGPIEIRGDANAPALDPIAWYGGNSGVGFELDNGIEPDWLKHQQYPKAKKSGTHPVKGKAPNPWGLYDMLGNVGEWTEDGWHENYDGAPRDGAVWEGETGGYRVVRGGSWDEGARFVRCAIRGRDHPGLRNGLLGFRCARVQA